MVFYAAGTTQATPQHKYGGLLYAYNENQIFLWHPMNSPLVFIGDRWGSGQWTQEIYNISHNESLFTKEIRFVSFVTVRQNKIIVLFCWLQHNLI